MCSMFLCGLKSSNFDDVIEKRTADFLKPMRRAFRNDHDIAFFQIARFAIFNA